MARALAPTKRELVKRLTERYQLQRQEQEQVLRRQRDEVYARLRQLQTQLKDGCARLPDPPELQQHMTTLERLGHRARAVTYDDFTQRCVSTDNRVAYTLQLTPELERLQQQLELVRRQRDKLDQQLARIHRDERDCLALVIDWLPDEATPHLEALQRLIGDVLAQAAAQ